MFEEILNFFFQNIFFLFILLFGLSQFFRRRTSNTTRDNEGGARKSPLPPVAKPFFEEWIEPKNQENNQEVLMERDLAEVVREEDQILTSERDEVQAYSPPILEVIEVNKEQPTHVQENHLNANLHPFRNPTRRNVAEGIIWAEILGPPRAKRKYMYRRYY